MRSLPLLLLASCFGLVGCHHYEAPIEQTTSLIEQGVASFEQTSSPASAKGNGTVLAPTLPVRNAPPRGKILIVPQKAEVRNGVVQWKWFIYGDPKWNPSDYAMSAEGNMWGGTNTAVLSHSSIPGPKPTGKASIYEYAIKLTIQDSKQGSVHLENEHTLRNVGLQPRDKPNGRWVDDGAGIHRSMIQQSALQRFDPVQVAKVLVTKEQTLSLPFDKPMVEFTVKKADGTTYKQVFCLKLAK